MQSYPNISNSIKPIKRWGQHFLKDKNLAKAIISLHNPRKEEIHLEIGPGTGQLTELLLQKCRLLIAVEIDERLAETLQERFSDKENLVILCQDVLKTDIGKICAQYSSERKKLRIIGNIPFYISSPLLHHLIKFRNYITDMTLMLQEEVAKRIIAEHNSKDYGYLSLMINFYCNTEICRKIPRQSFYPKPKVDATIVRLKILIQPRYNIANESFFFQLIKSAFSYRRKTISNSLAKSKFLPLSKYQLNAEIKKAGISPKSRAESLSLNEYFQLYRQLITYIEVV
jgi:16S rRNA (adenine1518-N6/adenine1519-N6)-dimethyltransferase